MFIKAFRMTLNTFKFLSKDKRESLSEETLSLYYQKMRNYYIGLADEKSINAKESNFRVVFNIAKPVFDLLYSHNIADGHFISKKNSLILVFNHRDYIDIPLIIRIMEGTPVHVLVKAELKNEISGKILAFIGSVPVDRTDKVSRKLALEALSKIVARGGNILISPEGTRNNTDQIMLPFNRYGSVMIARTTGCPIIPIAISKRGISGKKRLVRICSPIRVASDEDLRATNNKLRNIMIDALVENAELIPSLSVKR